MIDKKEDINMEEIKIDYDDSDDTIIEKVNSVIKEHGIYFTCDNKVHDGFNIYLLEKIKKEEV